MLRSVSWTAPVSVDKPGLPFEHRRQLVSTRRFTPEFKEEAVKQVGGAACRKLQPRQLHSER